MEIFRIVSCVSKISWFISTYVFRSVVKYGVLRLWLCRERRRREWFHQLPRWCSWSICHRGWSSGPACSRDALVTCRSRRLAAGRGTAKGWVSGLGRTHSLCRDRCGSCSRRARKSGRPSWPVRAYRGPGGTCRHPPWCQSCTGSACSRASSTETWSETRSEYW